MAIPQASFPKTAAIISRPNRPQVAQIVPGLLAWLADHGYKVIIDTETETYISGQEVVPRVQMASRSLDLVVVLGGDGTLLSAARVTAAIDVPLLGVNLGSLGFLTEVPLQSLYSMLEAIGQERAAVEQRSLMQVELLRGDEVRGSYLVFNDAVVNKTVLARLNTYDLYIDKVLVSGYRADFVVTPVAPHSLTHRPLVVPDSVEIEILLHSEEEVAYLSLDGQPGLDLRDGDRVRCRRSAHQVNLFRTGTDFFQVLRTKLNWGERQK